MVSRIANCQWTKTQRDVLIICATGTDKTFLACALAHKTCLEGRSVYYCRLPQLALARGEGSYGKKMKQLAKTVVLLDDWGLAPLADEQYRDLLEILDDRYEKRSTIVTSQIPIKLWSEAIRG